jgi:predicted trehalose synthase
MSSLHRRAVTAAVLLFATASAATAQSSAQPAGREQTADQQVHHVLGRLAFGPRPGDVERVRTLLMRSGLPTVAPVIGAARALELMGMDKKVLAGRIRLVLMKRLGEGVVTGDYPADALIATLESHFGAAA